MVLKFITTIIFFLILQGCGTRVPQTTTPITEKRNMSFLYSPGQKVLHPLFGVYHITDSISRLFIEIASNELTFNQANSEGKERTILEIEYRMIETFPNNPSRAADSLTRTIPITKAQGMSRYILHIPVKAKMGKKYILKIHIKDILRDTRTEDFVSVDKTNHYNSQNFLVEVASPNELMFNREFDSKTFLFIKNNNKKPNQPMWVSYFQNNTSAPPPVFSFQNIAPLLIRPDTLMQFTNTDTTRVLLRMPGIYHFRTDTSTDEGLTLFNFGDDYPKVTTPHGLLEPLIYLTTSTEFREMQVVENTKKAVDDFWLHNARSIDVSRELLRAYYNRVQYANLYFMADREGWKTDRGMVYCIFGPPKTLYKTEDHETWIYFAKHGDPSIEMTFKKVNSPFTQNLYMLQRDEFLNGFWREAVETWRSGEPYTF